MRLFLAGLMVEPEQWIVVGIDGQHGVALLPLAGLVSVPIPDPGYAERRTIRTRESGRHRFIGLEPGLGFLAMVRLEYRVCRDDVVLSAAPGVAKSERLGLRFAARVERRKLAYLVEPIGLSHGADETPTASDCFAIWYRFVASVMLHRPAHEHALVAWPHVVLADRGCLLAHAELLEQQLAVLQGLVVAAHGTLLKWLQYRGHATRRLRWDLLGLQGLLQFSAANF